MIRPSAIKQNDKAIIISPAGKIDDVAVTKTAEILQEWGLMVEIGINALCETGRFAGFVEQRLADLQKAMDDPDAKLILCSRGGYGTIHLLDKLNYSGIARYPKWIVGFSDITALLAALQTHGIESIHAPMASHFANEGATDEAVKLIKRTIAGQPVKYELPTGEHRHLNKNGKGRGRLFGGNLTVFCSLIGSKYLSVPRNGILFIEDIGESPYKIDRMMNQLKLSGILSKVRGLIVGKFTDYKEDCSMYASLYESIAAVAGEYDFPVCFDFPVGHTKLNFPLVVGANAVLTVKDDKITLK